MRSDKIRLDFVKLSVCLKWPLLHLFTQYYHMKQIPVPRQLLILNIYHIANNKSFD
jgi:hypothetical protein